MSNTNKKLESSPPADHPDANYNDDSARFSSGLLNCKSEIIKWRSRTLQCVDACEGIDPATLALWSQQGVTIKQLLADAQQTVIEATDRLNESFMAQNELHEEIYQIRQQRDELLTIIDAAQKQEPVAHFQVDEHCSGCLLYQQVSNWAKNDPDVVALYTHPDYNSAARIKELEAERDAAWRNGVVMALSAFNSLYDQPSMCASVLRELGIHEIRLGEFDDFDQKNIKLIANDSQLKLVLSQADADKAIDQEIAAVNGEKA